MIRVHETGLRRGGGHSEQTESSGCGPLPAYGGLSEDRLRRGGAPIHCFIGKPSELKTVHDPGGHWPPGSCYEKEGDGMIYRCTRPEPSPPASFSTSETVTRLKSPSMECFRAEAATANSMALWLSLPLSRA